MIKEIMIFSIIFELEVQSIHNRFQKGRKLFSEFGKLGTVLLGVKTQKEPFFDEVKTTLTGFVIYRNDFH